MYHYTESGLRNVYLKNGYTITKTEYGEAISIKDVAGLRSPEKPISRGLN